MLWRKVELRELRLGSCTFLPKGEAPTGGFRNLRGLEGRSDVHMLPLCLGSPSCLNKDSQALSFLGHVQHLMAPPLGHKVGRGNRGFRGQREPCPISRDITLGAVGMVGPVTLVTGTEVQVGGLLGLPSGLQGSCGRPSLGYSCDL